MLSAVQTWPFSCATVLLIFITVAEGVALFAGASLFHWLEHALHLPGGHEGFFARGLSWLHVGRVPLLALLVAFLAAFAMIGFALDLAAHQLLGLWLPVPLSVPLAVVGALPVVRLAAQRLGRVIPQDQSFAVTLGSLVGRVATVLAGHARKGRPAQAKVSSEHGQTLYVMVEPDAEGLAFEAGTSVLLVRQISGSRFAAIPNPRPDLLR